ncbi:MAG TPA: hypothetical protein VMW46_05945 [Candidatus Desulfaltia sp.]|nr:hypothetical protein [Candidatus Desulfaltia sp.]
MSAVFEDEPKIAWSDIILEALRGIKSEILLYGVVVAALLIGTAALGIEILKELKWPLVVVFTLALLAYFVAGAIPRARNRLIKRRME